MVPNVFFFFSIYLLENVQIVCLSVFVHVLISQMKSLKSLWNQQSSLLNISRLLCCPNNSHGRKGVRLTVKSTVYDWNTRLKCSKQTQPSQQQSRSQQHPASPPEINPNIGNQCAWILQRIFLMRNHVRVRERRSLHRQHTFCRLN